LRVPKTRLEERNNFLTVWNNSVVQNVAELRHNALVEPRKARPSVLEVPGPQPISRGDAFERI
jgi:hypothetical protein